MSHVTLLAITMAASLVCCITLNYITKEFENSAAARHIFNVITSVVAAVTLFALSGSMKASRFTVILAIVFGLTTAIQRVTHLQALEMGPFSYTSVIVSLSMLIPTLSGAAVWGESIHIIQIIGIALMIGCLVLSVDFSGEQKKSSLKWLFFCGLAFIGCGAIGVMQKWHQNTAYKEELNQFLVIAFITSAVYSAISVVIAKKSSKPQVQAENAPAKKKLLSTAPVILMIFCGICIAVNNILNLYLSGAMDSAVFFPVVNGGGLILTTLSALVLFKEKLSTKRWIGILLGIIAVILLCNPFA
ncbi:MAG: hypothetical protein IJ409_11910 [Lachnospiraceae bacterium]|nr:hypothetical protein [Lachnospiraceae bacterium]MBQ8598483.1 hypothetical protein [Lachnospiraceae bacterium]